MSKTLHQGLRVLELLAERGDGLTITEIATGIEVHRTVAHRLAHTLEAHRLVRRDRAKRFHLGAGLVPLAEPVERDLRLVATPLLQELADDLQATAHLVVREDEDTARAMLVIEPRNATVHVAFRPGQVDRIDQGSAGLALLAARPRREGERAEVAAAREVGYAVTFGEVTPAVGGISAHVPGGHDGTALSIGVSVFDVSDAGRIGPAVVAAAARLGRELG
ncbi:helix-turn-helix domain-containing protein [Nocardioides hwasunensis]|uniref:Helix-turn-helix domain-containing protein n=2 Tax=Nocardioides hwasunensis TaxID=397258 RepID=A0ABR8MPC9_9ACTN|nr:helix-turn-helix domain-containing protein [Nocardioides hwasunensis]